MEYAESLERAHRKDDRETNIYVEHPLRSSRPPGSTLQPTPDPVPRRKANYCAFKPFVELLQRPADHVSKVFVSSASQAADFKYAQTMCYQKSLEDRETVGTGLLQQPEGVLPTIDHNPSVDGTCYRTPEELRHISTITTGFIQPSSDGLPSYTNDKQVGYCRTPSQGRQTHEDIDAGMTVQKPSNRQVVVGEKFCPRCGQPKHGEVVRGWTESPIGYGTRQVLDAVTCLCCVKAVFYHCCSVKDDDTHCSDVPCSCTGRPLCCQRWTCLVLAGITCLPCLVLYWPIRIFLRLVDRCRDAYAGSRCSCAMATT